MYKLFMMLSKFIKRFMKNTRCTNVPNCELIILNIQIYITNGKCIHEFINFNALLSKSSRPISWIEKNGKGRISCFFHLHKCPIFRIIMLFKLTQASTKCSLQNHQRGSSSVQSIKHRTVDIIKTV